MMHEWDWPPTRRRRYYRTIDVYQPSGWGSPIARKAVRIYWRTMVTIVKVLISIPLAILAIGAFWLLWAVIRFEIALVIARAARP
jgi:hypothetical protein